MIWIFVIYTFLGWCTEVIFHGVSTGKFINRGFLNGPACPIYGFGMLLVVLCLTPLENSLAVLFFGSVLLTSALEFLTGFILEKFFDDKWWDYTNEPFNIRGYVCIRFSLMWGIACVLIMKSVQPLVTGLIGWIPEAAGKVLLAVFLLTMAADTGVTVAGAIKLRKRMRLMNELGERLQVLSSLIGEPLADGAAEMKERFGEGRLKLDESKAEVLEKLGESKSDMLEKLGESKAELLSRLAERRSELEDVRRKLSELASGRSYVQGRILRSFPRLSSGRYKGAVERIRQYRNDRKNG